MNRFVCSLVGLALLVPMLQGCPSVAIRDRAVYGNEIMFWRATADQSVARLTAMISSHCQCETHPATGAKSWTTRDCDEAATLTMTLMARSSYHADMMEFLGEIREERPPSSPPSIPPNTQLCPAE